MHASASASAYTSINIATLGGTSFCGTYVCAVPLAGGDRGDSNGMLQAVGAQVGGSRLGGREECREARGGGSAERRSAETVSVSI